MQNQVCFLLSYLKYGESDAILHCFSKELGFQSFFIKGIYSAKNKKKPYLFPLSQINITFIEKKISASMYTAVRIEKGSVSYDFDDVKINTILFFIADFLHQILREENQLNTIFHEIEKFLEEISRKNFNAHIAFIFSVLKIQGISPLISDEDFLDPESGLFSAIQNHLKFDKEISMVWKNFLITHEKYQIRLDRNLRTKTLESLLIYYQIHISGFYEPTSLAVITEVFD